MNHGLQSMRQFACFASFFLIFASIFLIQLTEWRNSFVCFNKKLGKQDVFNQFEAIDNFFPK